MVTGEDDNDKEMQFPSSIQFFIRQKAMVNCEIGDCFSGLKKSEAERTGLASYHTKNSVEVGNQLQGRRQWAQKVKPCRLLSFQPKKLVLLSENFTTSAKDTDSKYPSAIIEIFVCQHRNKFQSRS